MYKTSFIIQSYLTWESSCTLSSSKCHTSTPSDALKVKAKQKHITMFFFLCKGLRYLNILFYMLNLWRIKCHVIPHCCPRNPSLEFLICRSISKRFYLHWKAFYLLSSIRYILIMGGGTAGSLWHHQTRTCQPPEFKNLEMSWNLCIM